MTWGGVLREQKWVDLDARYRAGFQGKYSEKDDETSWNHYQLREWDGLLGRWLVPDPKRQHWSPYLGMGNNPILNVDPDGGFKNRFGAFLYKTFSGGGDVFHDGNEWVVQQQNKLSFDHQGASYAANFATNWGVEIQGKASLDFNVGVQFGGHTTGIGGLDLALLSTSLSRWDVNFGYSSSGKGFSFDRKRSDLDGVIKQFAKLDAPIIGVEYGNSQDWKGKNYEQHTKIHFGSPGIGLENTDTYIKGRTAPTSKVTLSGSTGARAVLGVDVGYEISFGKR